MSKQPSPIAAVMQAKFLSDFLSSGDAQRAYIDAGYEGDPEAGSESLFKRPFVQAALRRLADATTGAAIEKAVAQVKDRLQSREGLSEWLCGVIKGEHFETYTDKEGNEASSPTAMKDRLVAAKLLAQIGGMMAPVQVDLTSKGEKVGLVLLAPDNGRASSIPATVKVLKSEGG